MMQRESCGMDVAKRGVFTFCAFNDFNDLGVAKRAQTQLLRELLRWRPLVRIPNRFLEKLTVESSGQRKPF